MTESTETRIVEAAAQLFAERGYAGTTTRLLADRAGVNEVTIFRLFGSKKGLLAALFGRVAAEGVAAQAANDEIPADARDGIIELAMREFRSAERFGAVAVRMVFEASYVADVRELLSAGPPDNLGELARRFEAWQASGQLRTDVDPRVMAEAFSSLTSSFVIYRQVMGLQPSGDLTTEQTVRQLIEVFLGGVLAEVEGSK